MYCAAMGCSCCFLHSKSQIRIMRQWIQTVDPDAPGFYLVRLPNSFQSGLLSSWR